MKKSILFLLLMATISVAAQKYVLFPTENAQWNMHYKNRVSYSDYLSILNTYIQQGDTVINAKSYKKIYLKSSLTGQQTIRFIGGIREENKRIYWIDYYYFAGTMSGVKSLSNEQKNCLKQYVKTSNTEIVLYDFNAKNVGDTLFSGMYSGKILAVDSVLIQNSYRKRYTVECFMLTIGKYSYDYIIEGIGSVRAGLLNQVIPLLTCSEPPLWEFVSFEKDNQLVYKNPAYVNADSATRWEDKKYFDENDTWSEDLVVTSYLWGNSGFIKEKYQFYLSTDTLLAGKTYHKIINRTPNDKSHPTNYGGGIREENGKVYFKYTAEATVNEYLMYDFSLTVGDTIRSTYPTGYLSKKPVVMRIDTIVLQNGEKRKNFHTQLFSYMEGIGSPGGFFSVFNENLCTCDPEYSNVLVCFKKGVTNLYTNNTWCSDGTCCDVLMANPKVAEDIFKISINQTRNKISVYSVASMQHYKFELLDIKASILIQYNLSLNENTINISNLEKGLYLYRISANGVLQKAGKLVKQ
jgi:hypothetical protein